jgi:hypothetical protein
MPSTKTLANRLRVAFSQYTFATGDTCRWTPATRTIFYVPTTQPKHLWDLLHEIAHAELGHITYGLDVTLVHCEAQAWALAAQLAPQFGFAIDDDYLQDSLDTYRNWLYKRSTCPDCGQTGLQTKNTYSCINCKCSWRANEARICGLRRVKLLVQGQTS